MSSTTTTTATPIPAPTNTINPLPDTPAEAAARPAASGAALDLHTQTEDAADQYQSAQRTEKAYNEKKKCMSARKDWYDCKVHFAAGVQGFREGGKCVGRVVKASPSLVMEKVNGVKGKGVKGVDSETSGDSLVVEKEAANEKGGNGERVKAKVAGLKEKLLAIKEKRAVEKTAKANEKAGVVTAPAPAPATETATATEAGATPAAPVAATPAPAPAAPTKQEKKRMTLDQRIQQEEAKALAKREAEASTAAGEAAKEVPAPAPTATETPSQISASMTNPPQLQPKTQLSPPGSPTRSTMEPIHEDRETTPVAKLASAAAEAKATAEAGGEAPAPQ
ncbi:hypothetical protein EYC80_011147 [Monilinia laxa]|uniref:Uncharacterized protein n=1 Tax=Monilinia laxa TaxID=61186 RepID=A0A5N6JP67_MONLA|nr:hypothetical protein EYC80_011147 [Monilinia laxa]